MAVRTTGALSAACSCGTPEAGRQSISRYTRQPDTAGRRTGCLRTRYRRLGRECYEPDRYKPKQGRSEEHTSELQSLMRISYAVFCLKKKKNQNKQNKHPQLNKK